MKLKLLLVLGVAGTAAYLFTRKQNPYPAGESSDQGAVPPALPAPPLPSRLRQKLKRTVTGRRGAAAGTSLAALDDSGAGNDFTLARQVETTLELNPHFTKGRVLVSANAGRVTLRGTVDIGDDITAFEQTARAVPGVEDVQNLLHIQGTVVPDKHQGGLSKAAVDQAFAVSDH